VVVFIVVPKNQGLKEYKEKILAELKSLNSKILEVRGEDVGFWVDELSKIEKKVIGLTGEDLFKEYCLRQKENKIKTIRKIEWKDEKALFKKPVLCLIGSKYSSLEKMPKQLKVCIASKYKEIAKRYLNQLETKGYTFDKIYANGSIETSIIAGISDLIVDIVYTGKSIEEAKLAIYDIIFESNFLVIGGKND
jgi:ATP phosphoribosyltransferase